MKMKPRRAMRLLSKAQAVVESRRVLDPRLRPFRLTPYPDPSGERQDFVAAPLSPRETVILSLLSRGASYAAVASQLSLTADGLHQYLASLFGKFHRSEIAQVVRVMARAQLERITIEGRALPN